MFYRETTTDERGSFAADAKAWVKERKASNLCAISNHLIATGILCEACENDRLESASITRTAQGTGLTYENAEQFTQDRYVLDLFSYCARHGDGRDQWSKIVKRITESIDAQT